MEEFTSVWDAFSSTVIGFFNNIMTELGILYKEIKKKIDEFLEPFSGSMTGGGGGGGSGGNPIDWLGDQTGLW